MDMLDLELHLFAQVLVQRAEWLVHQHQFGFEHQCTGDGHTLLLTSGKLRRPPVAEAIKADHRQRPVHLLFRLGLAHAAHLKRKRQVFRDRHVREESVILKHHADAALVRRHVVDRLPVQQDVAVGRYLEPGEHHQHGGLAGAGRAEHRQKLAPFHVEVQVLHDQGFAVVALLHADELNNKVLFSAIHSRFLPAPPKLPLVKLRCSLCGPAAYGSLVL